MRGLLGVTLAVVVSAGCAREPETGFARIAPSYLGAAPAVADDNDEVPPASASVPTSALGQPTRRRCGQPGETRAWRSG